MGIKPAIEEFRRVQAEYSKNGASDTEPDSEFCMYVQNVFENGVHDEELLAPPEDWNLIGKKRYAAQRALTRAAARVGRQTYNLAKLLIWLQTEIGRGDFTLPRPKRMGLRTSPSLEAVRTWRLYVAYRYYAYCTSVVRELVPAGVSGGVNKDCGWLTIQMTKTQIFALRKSVAERLKLEKHYIVVSEVFPEEE